jgi:uncharacterized protein YcgI (DUF1989 family)
MTTSSTAGARDHARAQAGADFPQPDLPDGIDTERITWSERIPAEGYANVVIGRGSRLRLSDPHGAACAHLFLLRASAPWERLNAADTVKVPWQAYIGRGHPLLSDQGRVLATVVADAAGRHDALCGPTRTGRRLLTLAAAKQGLTPRDLGPTLSFFRGVRVEPDGALTPTGSAGPGGYLDLLVHLPVTLLIANTSHPLDDTPASALDVLAWSAPDELAAVPNTDPEYRRAVENTERAWRAQTHADPREV